MTETPTVRRILQCASCKAAAVGVTKFNATHDLHLLENALREDLNEHALRRMAVRTFTPLHALELRFHLERLEF